MSTPPERLALAVRAALLVRGEDGLRDACTTANHVLHGLCPEAERWVGTFEGRAHEWARVHGVFVDATVGQFPGAPAWVVAGALDARWQGERRAWQPEGAWPSGKAREVDALLALARRHLTFAASDGVG